MPQNYDMDKLFQLRRDELRYAALSGMEKRLGYAIKYVLLPVILLVTVLIHPDSLKHVFFYVYLGVFISGTLFYTYLHKRFLRAHRVAVMTLSSGLEVFCISFIYNTVTEGRLVPIVFLFLSLPILRLIMLYPAVSDYLLAAGSSSGVFVFVTATLGSRQLTLPSFWMYFASTWLIFGLGAAVVDKLIIQLDQSVRNRQLILQTLQMVSSLVEMAESTAHLREKNEIFQRAVEIVFRIMAVHSCVAWVHQDGKLYPAASEGLDKEQESSFEEMELSVHDVLLFDRALTQKVPIVVTGGDLEEKVPSFYRQCFEVETMLVIPLADKERTLGCVALHWRMSPEKITSQELAILSGIATQVGITLENVYLLEELREKEEIRGRLLERVISIQEEERERIARELHDETGQILTALMVNVELLKSEPEFQSIKSQERMGEISSLLSKTMEDIHSLSLDLHPKILNELGLVPAIRWYAKNHLERWGIDFSISADAIIDPTKGGREGRRKGRKEEGKEGKEGEGLRKEEICLFRVAQEAITNVIRHAHARRVDIKIGIDAESVYLSIRDDGKGFDAKAVLDSRHGEACLGLRSMEERVSFLGGQMNMRSQIGQGTEVSVVIPLQTGSTTLA